MSKVADYLDRKGLKYRVTGNEAAVCCPFCGDTEFKLGINLDTGLWKCWHANRCGKSGTFWTLQKELGDEPEGLREGLKHRQKQYRRPAAIGFYPLGASLLAWFLGRGISTATISRFGVAQSQTGEIVFPYYRAGKLINRKYRDSESKERQWQEKDAEPGLFGRDLKAKDADTLVIVEGEPDAMAAWQYGLEVVSVPSGASDARWIETEWDFLCRFKRLVLCLDMDDAGEKGVGAIAKRLGWRWDLARPELPCKDMNDCLMAGVPQDEVRGCIQSARSLGPKEVKALRDLPDDVFEKAGPGLPCSIPGLTEKLGGWRAGELTIHGGEAASGKTTGTCQEVEALLGRGERVCIASLEMPLRVLVAIMLLQSTMIVPEFRRKYGDLLYFIDAHKGIDTAGLLDFMSYAVQRFDVRHFVVDSLGCVGLPTEDYWLAQKDVVGKLVRFARDTETCVHLVHHLRKPGKESGGRVNHADLEGSAWIRNLADNVILYRRVREEDRGKKEQLGGVDAVLYVDKNRMQGEEGAIWLRFNRETRRFEPR